MSGALLCCIPSWEGPGSFPAPTDIWLGHAPATAGHPGGFRGKWGTRGVHPKHLQMPHPEMRERCQVDECPVLPRVTHTLRSPSPSANVYAQGQDRGRSPPRIPSLLGHPTRKIGLQFWFPEPSAVVSGTVETVSIGGNLGRLSLGGRVVASRPHRSLWCHSCKVRRFCLSQPQRHRSPPLGAQLWPRAGRPPAG